MIIKLKAFDTYIDTDSKRHNRTIFKAMKLDEFTILPTMNGDYELITGLGESIVCKEISVDGVEVRLFDRVSEDFDALVIKGGKEFKRNDTNIIFDFDDANLKTITDECEHICPYIEKLEEINRLSDDDERDVAVCKFNDKYCSKCKFEIRRIDD